jgi:ATPase subunit of ABC transporter with duplicated ATPase domains
MMASTGPDSFAPAVGADGGENVGQKLEHTLSNNRGAEEVAKAEKDGDDSNGEAAGWSLLPDVQRMAATDTTPGKALGVTWNDLTVTGRAAGAVIQENVFSQFNVVQQSKESRGPKKLKTIINKSSGCVKPGEMLLVLGRPGSGCTTLLKMLANQRKGYEEITGDIRYGSMDHKQAEQYRGQIVINKEEEIFGKI